MFVDFTMARNRLRDFGDGILIPVVLPAMTALTRNLWLRVAGLGPLRFTRVSTRQASGLLEFPRSSGPGTSPAGGLPDLRVNYLGSSSRDNPADNPTIGPHPASRCIWSIPCLNCSFSLLPCQGQSQMFVPPAGSYRECRLEASLYAQGEDEKG